MMPRFVTPALALALLVVLSTTYLGAAPPTPGWKYYKRMAKLEGIEKVRPLYKRAMVVNEAALTKRATLAPNDEQAVIRRTMPCEEILVYADSWAKCERRALSKGRLVHPEFDNEVWRPMVGAVRSAIRRQESLVKEINSAEAATVPEQRNKYVRMKELAQSTPRQRDKCLYSLAHLAKAAHRPDWVRDVFTIAQGRIATFKSAEDFLSTESDPDLDNTRAEHIPAAGDAMSKGNGPPATRPVTDDEKTAIRGLLDQWTEALAARDARKMRSFYDNPKLFDSLYAGNVAHSPYTAVDLSSATITYHRVDTDGPIHVQVARATVTKPSAAGGESKEYKSLKPLIVVFDQRQPKLLIKAQDK